MAAKKGSKSAGKKTRFIFGRDMSEDDMIKAIKKICAEAGKDGGTSIKL
jgi:hypothetical protein